MINDMINLKLFMFNCKRKELCYKKDYGIDLVHDYSIKENSIKIINDIINFSIFERATSDKFKYYLFPADLCENLEDKTIIKLGDILDLVIKINAYTSSKDIMVGLTIEPCNQLDDIGEIMTDLEYKIKLYFRGENND